MTASRDSGRAGALLDLSVPALAERVHELRVAARAFALAHGVRRGDDVALAVGEAVNNAVLHAYRDGRPGPVRLVGTVADGELTLLVEDRGCGMRPHPEGAGLGLGLPVMEEVTAALSFDGRAGGGTTVRLAFARTG
jgi:anti-sigma regulatory factor (Ser/Thr protein kinase)